LKGNGFLVLDPEPLGPGAPELPEDI